MPRQNSDLECGLGSQIGPGAIDEIAKKGNRMLFFKNLFSTQKRSQKTIFDFDIRKNGIYINDVKCKFDIEKLCEILGEPRIIVNDAENSRYLWDAAGVAAFVKNEKLIQIDLFIEIPPDIRFEIPENTFTSRFMLNGDAPLKAVKEKDLRSAYIFLDVTVGGYEVSLRLSEAVQAPIAKMSFNERYEKSKTDEIANIVRAAKTPVDWVSITPKKKKIEKEISAKYALVKPEGETLKFTNFNFKLAILNDLMYDQELLEPKFDVFEFCEERKIDPYKRIGAVPQVKKWFKNYEIPAALADKVSELYLDGGNDIYLNIAPNWDGEDSLFDIKNLDATELAQFKNLKKITAEMIISRKARKVLEDSGVEIEDE